VNSVEKGSPASRSGIESTDIILSFNGKPVESSVDLPRFVGATPPGSKVPLEVWRKGALVRLSITVGELKEERIAGEEVPPAAKPPEVTANRLGIVVSELSADQSKELGLKHGLVVTDVQPEARVEVQRGDVLLMLAHAGKQTRLESVKQLNTLLNGLAKDAVITLQVRRGGATAFVTVAGFEDRG
jgi:serine protease Do